MVEKIVGKYTFGRAYRSDWTVEEWEEGELIEGTTSLGHYEVIERNIIETKKFDLDRRPLAPKGKVGKVGDGTIFSRTMASWTQTSIGSSTTTYFVIE